MTRRTAGGLGLTGLATMAVLFLAIPVIGLVVRAVAGGALVEAFTTPAVREALVLSLVTTTISLGIVIVFGTPLALVLARRRFRGSTLLETVVDLPIVLPPSVAGLALLLVFGRSGILGNALEVAEIQIPFTTIAVVLAQVFVAAPFFVRAARAGIGGVDADLEDAARDLGAEEGSVIRRVTLPLAAPALAAGLVMCWSRALGEFGATIMFAGNLPGVTRTLPLVVYSEFQGGDLEGSIAAAAILILAAFGVLLAMRAIGWRRALDLRGGGIVR
ncbi:MAG TPA: ABC transporter permease [Candidatus Limnocylindria bacterium]|jgi:molybdate transport system permease protein